MTIVMAPGTFDVIHSGYINYWEKSFKIGYELVVVIARDSHVKSTRNP